MAKNKNMINAKKAKNDEFYTQLSDVCNELTHNEYRDAFKGKWIYCNCDDPVGSAFWKFFSLNFTNLQLKQLTSTHYDATKATFRQDLLGDTNGDGIIDDKDIIITPLQGNGDFRNQECIDILKQVDVVVTNPPFSYWRDYIDQLMTYGKKFVVIANMNSITYKETFSYIKGEKMWPGYGFNQTMIFGGPYQNTNASNRKYVQNHNYDPDKGFIAVSAIIWWTNIDLQKRHQPLLLCKQYDPQNYPKYDNYGAIEVSRVCDIPKDYLGTMGVPITYLGCHCPDQFEIIGIDRYVEDNPNYGHRFTINNKEIYARLLIKRK